MTPADIARLRALAEKATPGPWATTRYSVGERMDKEFGVESACPERLWGRFIAWMRDSPHMGKIEAEANAEFIAACDPQTVHALIAAAERAEAAERKLDRMAQRELDLMGRENIATHEGMAWKERAERLEKALRTIETSPRGLLQHGGGRWPSLRCCNGPRRAVPRERRGGNVNGRARDGGEPMGLEIHQWHTNIRGPRNAFQALMQRWLLGWETYYGVVPPWAVDALKPEEMP